VLWENLELGPFPPVLEIDSHGTTMAERAELSAQAWAALADRNLGHPNRIDRRLAARLRLLASPEWELDARIHRPNPGPRTSVLIAANRSAATIVARHADRLSLRTAPAGRIGHEALSLLPPHPPGTGASITLPADTLDSASGRAGNNPDALAQALESRGLGRAEARKIADVARGVTRFVHFGAARTRRPDPRRRASHVVSVYDSTTGRYLFTRKPSGGHLWVTLIPGTAAVILRQLNELLAELNRP
jgi:hypothetical protein